MESSCAEAWARKFGLLSGRFCGFACNYNKQTEMHAYMHIQIDDLGTSTRTHALCTYTPMHTHRDISVHIHIHTYIHIYIDTDIDIDIDIETHTYTRAHIHGYANTRTHVLPRKCCVVTRYTMQKRYI